MKIRIELGRDETEEQIKNDPSLKSWVKNWENKFKRLIEARIFYYASAIGHIPEPYPHYWYTIEGDFTDEDLLSLQRCHFADKVIEKETIQYSKEIWKPLYVEKGWGAEYHVTSVGLDNGKDYCGKLLQFLKGKKLSFHYHKIKDETFFLIKGKLILRISNDDKLENAEEFILNEGECFRIRPLLRHQMEALEDSELIEFSTRSDDNDSFRIVRGD